jgi:hypothetical protein
MVNKPDMTHPESSIRAAYTRTEHFHQLFSLSHFSVPFKGQSGA